MPRPALDEDEIAAFRRRAVDAAMHLFAEQGYEAVTMRSLGTALGVSAMTPYRYLSGKDELFVLVRAEAFRRFADALESGLAKAGKAAKTDDDVAGRLLSLKRAYFAFALAQPDAYRIMFEVRGVAAPTKSAAGAQLAGQNRRAFGFLYDCVVDAVERGYLAGDPLAHAHLFWASAHGLVSLHLAGLLPKDRFQRLAGSLWELGATLESPTRATRAPKHEGRKPGKKKS